jgi:hypothetical protein
MGGELSLGLLLDDQRQNHVDGRALPGGTVDTELALQLADTFAHSSDTDAEQRVSAIAMQRRRHADAVIAECQTNLRRRAIDGNCHRTSFGMAVHVGQRFLCDAEEGELDFLGKTLKITRDGEIHGDSAAFSEEPDVGTQADGESGDFGERESEDAAGDSGGNEDTAALEAIGPDESYELREAVGGTKIQRLKITRIMIDIRLRDSARRAHSV